MKKTESLLAAIFALVLTALPNLVFANLEEGRAAYQSKDFAAAFQALLPVAREGNAQAQHLIGDMYLNGTGAVKNAIDAAKWLRQSAERGNVDAMVDLAHLYAQGQGVAQDFREAEKWFRRAGPASIRMKSSAVSPAHAISDLNLGGGNNSPCKRVPPQMPRAAIQGEVVGTVMAELFLVDGKPRDVIIISGPIVFHEVVRKAMLQYDCASTLITAVAREEFVFSLDPPKDHYTVRQAAPTFAKYPPAFGSNWRGLSEEQRKTVHMQYPGLTDQDEPPYPNEGMGQLIENLRLVAEHLRTPGRLRLTAKIGGNGAIESVSIQDSPSPELSQYATAVVRRATFKGGTCAGQPCTLDLPLDLDITRLPLAERAAEFARLAVAAKSGDPSAQNDLGDRYERGDGVTKDLTQAVLWYRRSAEQGTATGQNNLARLYQYGIGIQRNLVEAANWFYKAAKQGDAQAQSNYGYMLEQGLGVHADIAESAKWYQKSAEQGNPWGRNNLGSAFEKGRGVKQDLEQAFQLYQLAADQGNVLAQQNLARAYASGRGVRQDLNRAVDLWRKSAEKGNAFSQFALGVAYMYGRGVPQDMGEAVKWYEKSAYLGNASGQNNLADAYENGRGVDMDLTQALKWYGLAAQQKNATAIFSLSHMYRDGRGVTQDQSKAMDMLRQAAELGSAKAQFELGKAYTDGAGVGQDAAVAMQWYSKAAKSGNQEAIDKLKELGVEI